ncbi:MAG TPA: cobyric acid synthase [Candidatus Binataceae bacterium]
MPELARTLMIQGTASAVGKSLMVAALCRIFRRDGIRVAPFKAQNMALNSFVTSDGLEIGRAQAVQAEAAGIEPAVEMNPILLKPEPGMRSQVVVMGKSRGSMTWPEYSRLKPEMRDVIARSLQTLREKYQLVVIEGAGSPAEINLTSDDIVNMHVARIADAPVVLVGDIDRGGVFAQLVGTMELLAPADRARIAGFIINKFRGEKSLLAPGLDFLAARFGVPVLGVVDQVDKLRIADEDSVALDDRPRRRRRLQEPPSSSIDIAVIRLPSIANFDDFVALEHEPDVTLRFIFDVGEVRRADLLVIPGSKSTVSDLKWLRREFFVEEIVERAFHNRPILGICGGCQMLGEWIEDPERVESKHRRTEGICLLPITTRFERGKLTAQVKARVASPTFFGTAEEAGEISGYEIHMGRVERDDIATAPFQIVARNGEPCTAADGAISLDDVTVGTMIHGLFENDALRAAMLRTLRKRKGIRAAGGPGAIASREAEYDRLAAAVREQVDLAALQRIAGLI